MTRVTPPGPGAAARAPEVWVFNPFAEARLAEGLSFTPPKPRALLRLDLANLPQYLCRPGDVVLTPERPPAQFLERIGQAGFLPPEFVELRDGRVPAESALRRRALGGLRPWAWGPDSLELFEPLFPLVTPPNRRLPSACFNEKIARLYSKAWSAGLLRDCLAGRAPEPWLCPLEEAGRAAGDAAEALALVAAIRRRGHHRVVLKQALGLAGANAIRLWEPEILPAQLRWLDRATAGDRQVVVEPWLERVADFSIQLEQDASGLQLRGYTGLITDLKGQFQANRAEAHFQTRPPPSALAWFEDPAEMDRQWRALYRDLFARLEREIQSTGYLGPVSLDAFVYREPGGRCRMKPLVEINPRHTMGRLLLELMTHARPGVRGEFALLSRAAIQREGCADFRAWARAQARRQPLRLEPDCTRLQQGTLCLADPGSARVSLPVLRLTEPIASDPEPPPAEK